MNAIKEGSVGGEASPGENIKHKRKNIERFLAAASAYGVPNEKLFAVDDLLLLQNLPRVTTCIFELGKLAEADRGFSGPQLGDLPYEPIDPKTKRRAGMPEGKRVQPHSFPSRTFAASGLRLASMAFPLQVTTSTSRTWTFACSSDSYQSDRSRRCNGVADRRLARLLHGWRADEK